MSHNALNPKPCSGILDNNEQRQCTFIKCEQEDNSQVILFRNGIGNLLILRNNFEGQVEEQVHDVGFKFLKTTNPES